MHTNEAAITIGKDIRQVVDKSEGVPGSGIGRKKS